MSERETIKLILSLAAFVMTQSTFRTPKNTLTGRGWGGGEEEIMAAEISAWTK